NDRKSVQAPTPIEKKSQPAPTGAPARNSEKTPALATATRPNPVETTSTKKTEISQPASRSTSSNDIKPSAPVPKPAEKTTTATRSVGGGPTPPGTQRIRVKDPSGSSADPAMRRDVPFSSAPAAPRPTVIPPSTGSVASNRTTNQPETITSSVPTARP